jgi:hypothetical protein
VAIVESDSGAGPAEGWSVDLREKGSPPAFPPPPPDAAREARQRALLDGVVPRLQRLARFLEPLDAAAIKPGHAGADLEPMLGDGVLGLGFSHDASHYFDVHHTRADTFDKVDKRTLRKNVAALAVMAYLLAEVF